MQARVDLTNKLIEGLGSIDPEENQYAIRSLDLLKVVLTNRYKLENLQRVQRLIVGGDLFDNKTELGGSNVTIGNYFKDLNARLETLIGIESAKQEKEWVVDYDTENRVDVSESSGFRKWLRKMGTDIYSNTLVTDMYDNNAIKIEDPANNKSNDNRVNKAINNFIYKCGTVSLQDLFTSILKDDLTVGKQEVESFLFHESGPKTIVYKGEDGLFRVKTAFQIDNVITAESDFPVLDNDDENPALNVDLTMKLMTKRGLFNEVRVVPIIEKLEVTSFTHELKHAREKQKVVIFEYPKVNEQEGVVSESFQQWRDHISDKPYLNERLVNYKRGSSVINHHNFSQKSTNEDVLGYITEQLGKIQFDTEDDRQAMEDFLWSSKTSEAISMDYLNQMWSKSNLKLMGQSVIGMENSHEAYYKIDVNIDETGVTIDFLCKADRFVTSDGHQWMIDKYDGKPIPYEDAIDREIPTLGSPMQLKGKMRLDVKDGVVTPVLVEQKVAIATQAIHFNHDLVADAYPKATEQPEPQQYRKGM